MTNLHWIATAAIDAAIEINRSIGTDHQSWSGYIKEDAGRIAASVIFCIPEYESLSPLAKNKIVERCKKEIEDTAYERIKLHEIFS